MNQRTTSAQGKASPGRLGRLNSLGLMVNPRQEMERHLAFLRITLFHEQGDQAEGQETLVLCQGRGLGKVPAALGVQGEYCKGFMAFKSKARAWKAILSLTQVHRSG